SSMAIIDKGEVVLSGDPARVLEDVRGRIWRKTVAKSEIDDAKRHYDLISTRLIAGTPVIHVFSETNPGPGFAAVEAGLEDVYFHCLNGRGGGVGA
ncbi:MAG: ABC transporter ATP-binding protein, partial [Gemmatimonadaceae bacterium]